MGPHLLHTSEANKKDVPALPRHCIVTNLDGFTQHVPSHRHRICRCLRSKVSFSALKWGLEVEARPLTWANTCFTFARHMESISQPSLGTVLS